ncbi:LTA synthase family protein [Sporosarcina thermotolerans]|uniref:LTA synthase family protein n=1 Tax=Sporosarcina thermotolerans TaxID=633404 RepID=A0AAW9A7H7_9BACL|nr:LTA synthase family protein [Sporosarcina thermotolerans]MDW0117347.1 LTA synthase family protein [Sporosarcina thermotolerans]WHT47497.1 LTA synthase family protein [Sporosarcina thermotolerans]
MKKVTWPKHSVLGIAIVATWLTTYIGYITSFNMKIDNMVQELILFINPLSFLLFLYGLALFIKSTKRKNIYIISISLITSIIMFSNAVFYRFFSDFITLPLLFQTNNFGDLSSSATANMHFTDIFFFADVIIIALAIKFIPQRESALNRRNIGRKLYFVVAATILMVNLALAEAQRPQLLTRSFDRELLVKNIGTYNYHIYDLFIQSKTHAQRALADGSELTEVANYINANYAEPNPKMFGAAEGRNLIIVSMESLQNFVINNKMNEYEITPFLNSLTKDKDTFYFNNFYHQTGLGKTSDSEFILENSLYGRNGGAVFFTNSGNTFNSLSEKLGHNGYFTSVMHANNRSFWNRDIMYQALGTEKFYDVESYEIGEGQAVNWGMKDIPFLEQSVDLMKEMPQPFATRLITLTNHHPFDLDEEDMMIPQYDSNSKTVNKYFQAVRYMDEALKIFFDDLKQSGLYDNSIIVMYGDHYGISENHNKAMGMYMDKEITPFDNVELQKVPMFIHIPGYGKGKTMDELSGQLDLRPTILHLLGVDTKEDMQMGADVFSPDHEPFVIFRDGRLVTENNIFTNEVCYDISTGEETDNEACEPYVERATTELDYSDLIINGDLLRFTDDDQEKSKTKMH